MRKNISRNLARFIQTLQKNGVLDWAKKLQKELPKSEVYLVGGAVRDAILPAFAKATAGKVEEIKDLDFVVRKVSMKNLEKILSRLGWVELLGKNFGVLKFRPKGLNYKRQNFEPLDIALPRREFSTSPGGYRDFKVKFNKDLNIEQDLLRRDFTINAMAVDLSAFAPSTLKVICNPIGLRRTSPQFLLAKNKACQLGRFNVKNSGLIIDPFNGLDDIKNKIIRCVGNPEERLSEDYTRILRAVRFACQLNFKIEKRTKAALKKLAPHLNDKDEKGEWIAVREVIARELLQAILAEPLKALDLYDKLGLLQVLMPEVLKMKKCVQPKNFHTEGDVWQHTRLALEKMDSRRFKVFSKKLDKIFNIKTLKHKNIKTQKANEVDQAQLELFFGLLFHDIGKPLTIETPEKDGVDRIRFNDHDNVGANLAEKICKRLALSAPAKIGISPENVAWLVKKHMMLIHGHPSQFRPTTVEKYFFSERYPGKNLIKLAYLDSLATIPKSGKLEFDLIMALLKRMKEMKSLVKKKQVRQMLPTPLLDGDEIMQLLKIKPGKKVGEIKEMLREKQLTGEVKSKKEAREYVKNIEI